MDSMAIDGSTLEHLRSDFPDRQVLFLPSRPLSPDKHEAFGRDYYNLQVPHPGLVCHPDNPHVFFIRTEGGEGLIKLRPGHQA